MTPSEALETALLSNANLGGDCCNRGLLLGSVLGAAFGASNIPSQLINGLKRRDELLLLVDGIADLILQQFSTGMTIAPRFGRPSPLPTREYSLKSAIHPSIDFHQKLYEIRQISMRIKQPICNLRFIRDIYSPLDFGDAARDRKEALNSSASASASSASASSLTREKDVVLETNKNKDDAIYEEGILNSERAGSGIFYYASSTILTRRFELYTKLRAQMKDKITDKKEMEMDDPVSVTLQQEYGIKLPIKTNWFAL
jgi:hypothetical protein